MELVKLKIVRFLLKYSVKIGHRLAFYNAKLSAGKAVNDVTKRQKFDLRGMKERVKAVMLHDQDIIDKRWAECEKCEHFVKITKQCDICKCFMPWKTRIATTKCPADPPKWDAEYNFMEGKPANGTQPVVK